MKILLSPAKRLNSKIEDIVPKSSIPQNLNQASKIIEILESYSIKEIEDLMHLSTDLATLNYERYKTWSKKSSNSLPAAWLFDGEVYRGLHTKKLDNDSIAYLQNNLRILSGLYGILKPLDLIDPYRLEMGTKLRIDNKLLYKFWQPIITQQLIAETSKDDCILNLASAEYSKAIDFKKIDLPIIEVKFKDYKNGKLKQINVFLKKARGSYAAWCAFNKVRKKEDLIHFTDMNYQYTESLSTETTLVFTR